MKYVAPTFECENVETVDVMLVSGTMEPNGVLVTETDNGGVDMTLDLSKLFGSF